MSAMIVLPVMSDVVFPLVSVIFPHLLPPPWWLPIWRPRSFDLTLFSSLPRESRPLPVSPVASKDEPDMVSVSQLFL